MLHASVCMFMLSTVLPLRVLWLQAGRRVGKGRDAGRGLLRGCQRRRLHARVPSACPSHSSPWPTQPARRASGHSCPLAIATPSAAGDWPASLGSPAPAGMDSAFSSTIVLRSHSRRREDRKVAVRAGHAGGLLAANTLVRGALRAVVCSDIAAANGRGACSGAARRGLGGATRPLESESVGVRLSAATMRSRCLARLRGAQAALSSAYGQAPMVGPRPRKVCQKKREKRGGGR